MWTSDRRAALLVLLLAGQSALAQYATGEEHPLRPEPTGGGKVITPRTDQNTAAAPAEPAEQTAPIGDNIDAYTAAQIVEQAKAEAAAKAATAATNQETTAQPAPETTTAQPQPEAAPNNEDDPAFALLPVEKLSPAAPPTETVIIERAIYRCAQGNKNVYVDADAKKRYSKCTLFRWF